jgi:phenylacetate-CoA ligase
MLEPDRRDKATAPADVRHVEPEFEAMSRASLRNLQLRMFKSELERAWHGNAFYRSLYERSGVAPDDIRSLDDVRIVPVVRKGDLLADCEQHPPYGSRLQVPKEQIAQVVETSGTSGRAREVHALTSEDVEQVIRSKLFQFVWPGCGRGSVVALHNPISMASGPLWSLLALERLGVNVLRLGTLDATARLHYMRVYEAELLQASGAYIMRLEYAAEQMGLDLWRDLPCLRALYVTGGGWTVEWAQDRARRWGARLFEVYANTQRAFTYTCELGVLLQGTEPGLLHSLPHLGLLEVIDPETGRHVADGEHGEVVITPFRMTASPVIRYATGDRAIFRRAESCPCGRAFDGLQAGSVARYDDMLRVKEVNVWPETVDQVVFARTWATEYRGELFIDERGSEIARVLVEFDQSVEPRSRVGHLADLGRALHERTGLHFSVEEWTGPPLRDTDGAMDRQSLKIKRWSDRRPFTMSGSAIVPPAGDGAIGP